MHDEAILMSIHTIYHFQYKKKITLNYPKSAATIFSKKLINEFETAVVNEPYQCSSH